MPGKEQREINQYFWSHKLLMVYVNVWPLASLLFLFFPEKYKNVSGPQEAISSLEQRKPAAMLPVVLGAAAAVAAITLLSH